MLPTENTERFNPCVTSNQVLPKKKHARHQEIATTHKTQNTSRHDTTLHDPFRHNNGTQTTPTTKQQHQQHPDPRNKSEQTPTATAANMTPHQPPSFPSSRSSSSRSPRWSTRFARATAGSRLYLSVSASSTSSHRHSSEAVAVAVPTEEGGAAAADTSVELVLDERRRVPWGGGEGDCQCWWRVHGDDGGL